MDPREFFVRTKNENHPRQHAYLIVGDKTRANELIDDLFVKILKIEIVGNSSIRRFEADFYSIDEARELKAAHFMKPVDERTFFIVNFNSIGTEAQQSLLKVFEDPMPGNHFFVITPTLRGLLPTLLSRFSIVRLPTIIPDNAHENTHENIHEKSRAEQFIKSKPPERIKQIKSLIENKDKSAALVFLNELEIAYSKLFHSEIKSGNSTHVAENAVGHSADIKEIISARDFLQTRSPSVKMLLEHLSLILK